MAIGSFFCWPKRVVSGPGAIQELDVIIKEMGKNRVIVITDKVMQQLPLVTNMVDKLKNAGLNVSVFGDIGPNPVEEMVHNAVAFMQEVNPEVLVCIGGGSPIDAGKAANVVFTHGGIVNDYDIAIGGIMKITPKLLPLIAIPTTAGTGTEVTFVGVITDTTKQTKFGVLSPLLIPDVALLDPELTISMPPSLTAFTGIDALTHCIEAYTSIGGYPPAEALALHGIKMISPSLRTPVQDGQDLQAREEMLTASMMAGTAFSLNGLGACHAMAHQLSAIFDIPHGLANAILLPRVMKYNIPANPQKFAAIAEAMGADIRGLPVQQAAEKALALVEQLAAD
ncbi:MAG: iron-containing alcohol dehydrogenase, partial [Desulfotomaculaceae bacterium]